jgi:predicted XRE-type DNA-binding protein
MKLKPKFSKTPPPGWPSEEEWKKMDKLLENAPGTRLLPPNASPVDRFKFELCRQFVVYLQEKKVTQRELAKKLKTTEARVSEIVHYHLDKVTTDRLIGYLGIIRPGVKIKVAS